MKVRYTTKGNIEIKLNEDEAQQLLHLVNWSEELDYEGAPDVDKSEVEDVSIELYDHLRDLGFNTET